MWTAIFGWASTNVKWIVIGMLVVALSSASYKMYREIQQNAAYSIQLSVLKDALKDQQKVIRELEMDARLVQDILSSRDVKIDNLNKELHNLTNNLGPDQGDQAPESIKELIRRLKK